MTIAKHQIKVKLQQAQEVKQERKKKITPKKQSINEIKKEKDTTDKTNKEHLEETKDTADGKKALQNRAEDETQT